MKLISFYEELFHFQLNSRLDAKLQAVLKHEKVM